MLFDPGDDDGDVEVEVETVNAESNSIVELLLPGESCSSMTAADSRDDDEVEDEDDGDLLGSSTTSDDDATISICDECEEEEEEEAEETSGSKELDEAVDDPNDLTVVAKLVEFDSGRRDHSPVFYIDPEDVQRGQQPASVSTTRVKCTCRKSHCRDALRPVQESETDNDGEDDFSDRALQSELETLRNALCSPLGRMRSMSLKRVNSFGPVNAVAMEHRRISAVDSAPMMMTMASPASVSPVSTSARRMRKVAIPLLGAKSKTKRNSLGVRQRMMSWTK